jgi:murein DD-endopeptidase MepM/ murein hydrolase activator NlpD
MKYKVLLSLIIISFSKIAFGHPDPNEVVKKTIIPPIAWDITDSLYHIPAYDRYCGFDQTSIWGFKIDQTKTKDTSHFELVHDSCDFQSPWTGRVTSSYGWRNNRPHYGVDIKLNTGDSVKSAFEGMVRVSKYSRSYGNVVVIRHQNGLETLYAHLSKRTVKVGDVVKTGNTLGLGGNTGRSFGSHLHFETRYLGEPLNPMDVFEITDTTFKVHKKNFDLTAANFAFVKEVRKIKHHRVRSGDSLWRISKRYGISINRLCRINKINRKKTLRIGQKIRYN